MHLHRLYEGSDVLEYGLIRPPRGPGLDVDEVRAGDQLEEWRPDPHDIGREIIWRLMRQDVAVHVIRIPEPPQPAPE